MNDIFPVIFFGLTNILTDAEQKQLLALQAEQSTPAEQAQYKALQSKAEITTPLALRFPIILDGDVIPAHKVGHTTQMNKSISLVGDKLEVSSVLNSTTITIESVNDTFSAIVSDLLFMMADLVFARLADKAPSISFFGGSVVIPNGYLAGITRAVTADTNKEVINLTIVRDLNFSTLTEGSTEVAPIAETTEGFF